MTSTSPPSPSIWITSPTPPPTEFISSLPLQTSSSNILNGVDSSSGVLSSLSHKLALGPGEARAAVEVEGETPPVCTISEATVDLDERDTSHSMPEPPAITHPEEPAEALARLPRYRRFLITVRLTSAHNTNVELLSNKKFDLFTIK